MSRRSRSAQRKNQEFFGGASPHIKRSIPFFDILDEEQLEILEDQVDWLIENIGIALTTKCGIVWTKVIDRKTLNNIKLGASINIDMNFR